VTADEETFVWRHLERRLQNAGVNLPPGELRRWISVRPEPVAEAGAAQAAGGPRVVKYHLGFHHGDLSIELNARTGNPLSWSFPALAEGKGGPLPEVEALNLAEATAALPEGAVLLSAGYETLNGRSVFVAHWEHREGGVRVERDYIRVLISGDSGRVFAMYRRWHVIEFALTER
jgi:hypothetical protein